MSSLRSTLIFATYLGLSLAQTQVTVNTGTTYQTIDGFGFSEAFGFGGGVQNAPSAQQTQALNYMFSTTKGAGFTILRNRIAADSSSIEPNSPGSPSANPTYVGVGADSSQVRIQSLSLILLHKQTRFHLSHLLTLIGLQKYRSSGHNKPEPWE